MNTWMSKDPPAPSGVTPELWRDALKGERLRVVVALAETGCTDRSGLPAARNEYKALLSKVGWDLILEANKALSAWIRQREELADTMRMRLPVNDERAWKRVSGCVLSHFRKQFPVGQGGFHVGIVREVDRPFPRWEGFQAGRGAAFFYVYDCGSEPREHVDRAIKDLLGQARGRTIDLMCLSHFDRDHMCGTPRLLASETGLHADTVVMPYVDHVERVIAFGRSVLNHRRDATDIFFEDMVVDPVETLGRFNPRQIILVLADEAPLPVDEESPPVAPLSGPSKDGSWTLLAKGGGPVNSWAVSGGRAVVVRHPSFLVSAFGKLGGWRLVPYVQRADPAAVDLFKSMAEMLLDWERGSFTAKVGAAATRRELVTKKRNLLARAYKYAFHNKNITSLCLYSGPECPDGAGAVQISPSLEAAPCAKIAWMGTGDADLADAGALKAFENHYRDVLDYVATYMFPHHGSAHNSDPDHLVSEADVWVAAAEPRHKTWSHPAKALRDAVGRRGGTFKHVRSATRSALSERMVVFWPT